MLIMICYQKLILLIKRGPKYNLYQTHKHIKQHHLVHNTLHADWTINEKHMS